MPGFWSTPLGLSSDPSPKAPRTSRYLDPCTKHEVQTELVKELVQHRKHHLVDIVQRNLLVRVREPPAAFEDGISAPYWSDFTSLPQGMDGMEECREVGHWA